MDLWRKRLDKLCAMAIELVDVGKEVKDVFEKELAPIGSSLVKYLPKPRDDDDEDEDDDDELEEGDEETDDGSELAVIPVEPPMPLEQTIKQMLMDMRDATTKTLTVLSDAGEKAQAVVHKYKEAMEIPDAMTMEPVALLALPEGSAPEIEEEPDIPSAPEEPATWIVLLTHPGVNKIQVIKVVREITTMGLKEAKDLVESVMPQIVIKDIDKETAESYVAKFTEQSAVAIMEEEIA